MEKVENVYYVCDFSNNCSRAFGLFIVCAPDESPTAAALCVIKFYYHCAVGQGRHNMSIIIFIDCAGLKLFCNLNVCVYACN